MLVATASMHSIINAVAMATSSRIVQGKFSHQKYNTTKTGHAPDHIMTTTVGMDPSSFITDAAKNDTLTSQDHTTDPTTAEVPATIRGMHSVPHHTTTAASDTYPTERCS